MPGAMSGVDLAREIRQRRPELPVLLTTGYASGALKKLDAEALPVLHKPYGIAALDSALRAALFSRC